MTPAARRVAVLCMLVAAVVFESLEGAVHYQSAPSLPVWMVGCWSGDRDGERFHERWIAADGSTLLAVAHTTKAGVLSAFEFLRVIVRNGQPVYIAQPGGKPPTEFAATAATVDRVVFENPSHDFPKRVTYERNGNGGLTASIDGGEAGGERIEYAMTRQPCER